MSPADPPWARPWAILDAATPWPGRPDTSRRFGGAVTLDAPAWQRGAAEALRASLREVPEEVATVVFLDRSVEDPTGALVADLLTRLGDADDAVAVAAPVTDALKRVDGDRVVASVDRRGLYGLRAPHVLRRGVLAAVLETAPEGPADPAALLLAAGRRVRMVPVAGGGPA